jgi:glycosyltransferase involved in cell wall biosynthesis
MEDGLRNLDTYLYLAGRKALRRPVAFWGHGRTMDKTVGEREEAFKRGLLRTGDWWFAYTAGVAEYLSGLGIPAGRITSLQNTFATESLIAAREQLLPAEAQRRRSQLGLTEGHSCLFIGGLSETKNLDLLIEAGRIAAARDPLLRVVVAGDGPQRPRLEGIAQAEDWLRVVGPVFEDREKALLAAACDLMAVPGLVGLVAIDSFALGIPIVAIEPWNHAPEFEYLRSGENSLIAGARPNEYAEALLRLLGDRQMTQRLAQACRADSARYTLDSMVSNFTGGVLAALEAGRRKRGS